MTLLDTIIEFIVCALFNSVWQATLCALAAWLVLRLQPTTNATTRHSVYFAALAASVLLPIATAVFAIVNAPASTVVNSVSGAARMRSAHHPSHHIRIAEPSRVAAISDRNSRSSGAAIAIPGGSRAQLSVPRNVAVAVVALWSACAAFILIRLAISLLYLERLKRNALPVDVAFRAQLPRWTAMAQSLSVRLCRSNEIAIPIAVGLGDAMILLPEIFLSTFEAHDIDAIVLHELAHLRRGDDWFNALGRCAGALLFWNPAMLWLRAQIDLEREVACDDWVLQQQKALPYATCLARVVESACWPYRAAPAPGAFVTRRGMSVRIERLLASERDVRVRTGLGIAALTLAMLSMLSVVAIIASPSIAYTISPPLPVAAAPIVSPSVPVAVSSAVVGPVARSVAMHPARLESEPSPRHNRRPKVRASMTRARLSVRVVDANRAQAVATMRKAIAQANVDRDRVVAESTNLAIANVNGAQAVADSSVAVAQAGEDREQGTISRSQIAAEAASPDYINELAGAGYSGLSIRDLIQLKSLGVSASLIRSWQHAGARGLQVDELIRLRALGIDDEYVRAMRQRYGDGTSIDDILGLKAIGVSSKYTDALAASGIRGLTLDQARSLRALDVRPSFIRDLAQAGYPNLSVEQIEQLQALGIDAAFITRAAVHGYHHLSIDELTRLKVIGVL